MNAMENDMIIRQIVGRCHVGEDYLSVLRYLKSRMVKGAWKGLDRKTRRALIEGAINQHTANRLLYREVMSGRIGR